LPTQLTLLGLGPAGLSLLSGETIRALEAAPRLILRTGRHPAADELRHRGIAFETLDSHYQEAESFGALYPRLAEAVLAAAEAGPVAYAVPGHPLLGEESVRLTLAGARERGITARVLAAPGFVDVVATALAAAGEFPDLTQWQVADGHAAERVWWDTSRPTLVFQVDDAFAASRVKLALLEEYPEQFTVWVVRCAGDPERESVRPVPLHALDHAAGAAFDHLTTVYVPALPPELKRAGFPELEQVVARLRAPDGCPWDREQTYGTLKRYVLEEAYEVVEAIEDGDPETLCEELGDLALQVVMLAQLGREEGYFDLRDAASSGGTRTCSATPPQKTRRRCCATGRRSSGPKSRSAPACWMASPAACPR
jgi:tetrapyrrole methylase family protein/MazG family protein